MSSSLIVSSEKRRRLHDSSTAAAASSTIINRQECQKEELEATRDMCVWCFELLCYKLGRYDLVDLSADSVTTERNSSERPLPTDLSLTYQAKAAAKKKKHDSLIPYPHPLDSRSRDRFSASESTMCSSSASSMVGGSSSESTIDGHQASSQPHRRHGWKQLWHRGGNADMKVKHRGNSMSHVSANASHLTKRKDCGSASLVPVPTTFSGTSGLRNLPKPPLEIRLHSEKNIRAPLFVTWMYKRHSDLWSSVQPATLTLRGCIGSLDPVPIEDLASYADKAAFHDGRFKPIDSTEIDHLECRVSILKNFELCLSAYDWDIDVHGVTVNFSHPDKDINREYQATFLPGVAKEHNMTYRKTLEELIRKAGYRGVVDSALIDTLKVVRYQASKHKMTFVEFQEHVKRRKAVKF